SRRAPARARNTTPLGSGAAAARAARPRSARGRPGRERARAARARSVDQPQRVKIDAVPALGVSELFARHPVARELEIAQRGVALVAVLRVGVEPQGVLVANGVLLRVEHDEHAVTIAAGGAGERHDLAPG